ncbi:helix-turn-helix domain-containing protein [Ideonella livida]|uniref:Helix-turn-helix domain-containing protein n=1 Tax=Ideonella livida TaxID=2707176 RepID=A0A7C9TM50_9BURK|nr:helix-turn-helix transcriptional regulator [Ideonella livida]NDY92067.1 helix-turn-helix domain-containing protein [Ideonella livida]
MQIDAFLAQRLRELRQAHGLTLEQLAERSGVSRSMISLIERQETSPTAAVLHKLADAFGLPLPALFTPPAPTPQPVARLADQPVWTDPASGYQRRQLTPGGVAAPVELVEVHFPAGQSVDFDIPAPRVGIEQQLWMLEGNMLITLAGAAEPQRWLLASGDCLAMTLGERITFHNPGPRSARYLLALTRSAAPSRRLP